MTFLLALSSLLSRLLGVYRNHALADAFGATALSDAYFAAFQVPDTVYRLLVFGAISASFVPLFLALQKQDQDQAQDFVASVMNGFLIMMIVVLLVIFVFSAQFVAWLYPAFDPENQTITVQLLRIMLLSPLFFTCSSLFSGVQNAFRTFWGYALAPIVYNIGILIGIELLAPSYGIAGVAYGVVLGSLFHALVQWWPAHRLGFRWSPRLHWSPAFKKLLVTAIPRILSMASFQVNFFIEGVIATLLFAGNLTVLRYAQDIQSFPIGIIGISIAVASFSVLSHFVIDQQYLQLSQYLREKTQHILLLMIPASFGLYVLKEPVVKLILEGGVFDAQAVALTSETLAYLCLGLIAAALMPLVTRVFFAFHDTIRPFMVMVMTVFGNSVLAWILSQQMGVSGIGLSSAVTSSLSVLILMVVLQRSYLQGQHFFPYKHASLFVIAAAVMTFFLQQITSWMVYSQSTLVLLGQICFLTILGAGVYGSVLFVFMRKELFQVVKTLGK